MEFRRFRAAPAVLAVALALPAAAHASRADVVGDTLFVQGGALQRNDIEVAGTRNAATGAFYYLVTELRDGGPRILAGDQCTTGANISAAVAPDGLFGALAQQIAANPLVSELAHQLRDRAKTVGCIATESGSFLDLGGGETIKKIVIDTKDSADSATVDFAAPPGLGISPLLIPQVEMHGGAQDDLLSGGPNADVLLGEKGDDRIMSRDGVPDQVLCGAGSDIALVDLRDVVTGDCETIQRLAVDAQPGASIQAVRRAGRRVHARLACPAGASGGCRGTLSLRSAKHRVLASLSYRLAAGARRPATLRAPARRALRLVATERDQKNRPKTFTIALG